MNPQDTSLKKLRKVAFDLGNRMEAHLQKKIDKRSQADHSAGNWASEVPHPCERFLVYARTRWRERPQPGVHLQARFDAGTAMEDEVEEHIKRCGYKVMLQQLSTSWAKYQLRGKIDGFIVRPDRSKWPIEITSVMPWYWASTNSIEAIKNHAKHWIRKKVGQLNLYLLLEEYPGGFLIIGSFGKLPRVLPMLLDYGLAEQHIKTCVAVNEHVAAGTLPPRIEYSSDVCGLCDYAHICKPLETVHNLVAIKEADYAALLRYCALQEPVDEFAALHNRLIGTKEKPGTYYGTNAMHKDVEISTRTWPTKNLKLPPTVRKMLNRKYQVKGRASSTTINFIGGGENVE